MATQNSSTTRRQRRSPTRPSRGRRTGLVALAAVTFLAVIVYFTWQEAGGTQSLSPDAVTDPALGAAGAPVVITEYADFGCPACRAWHRNGIRDQVLAAFGDQVQFVWKDFPVITPLSPQAAEAGQCAAVQGKFWEFHDTVYDNYAGLELPALRGYAEQIGLDMTALDRCLDQATMRRKVQVSEQEAGRLGLRGTPGFAINGRPLPAPPSYAQLAALIKQELAGR